MRSPTAGARGSPRAAVPCRQVRFPSGAARAWAGSTCRARYTIIAPAMAERQRSLWAWGWADRFPDEASRTGMMPMVGALVPGVAPALRPLPADEPDVPAPSLAVPGTLA